MGGELEKHAPWIERLRKRNVFEEGNVEAILRIEVGRVFAQVKRVPDWRKRGSLPADLPVLPHAEGECVKVELVPYAEAPCRIALFPKGDEA